MSAGVPLMGCRNPIQASKGKLRRIRAVFLRRKIKTPDTMVRRVAEYPIRDTIPVIVSNLLTTKFFGGFLIQKINRSLKMKSKIIIAGAILCAITTTGAHAVTKCVALNSNTICTVRYSQYAERADWAATCEGTQISGIGICSSTTASNLFNTATELEISATTDENIHCWCRMITPAVSRWVYIDNSGSTDMCATYCAHDCAKLLDDNDMSFASALFGSLSD